MKKIELLYIDLFCGAGGTSSGVEYATVDGRKCAEVTACVNHDANAIKSHAANHPKTMHFTENYTLIGTQAEQKKFIGNAVEVNMSRVLCEALARRLMDKSAQIMGNLDGFYSRIKEQENK